MDIVLIASPRPTGWDIASQPTDEAQADKAIDVYWDMLEIKHAPQACKTRPFCAG
ncbi:MAG: hypothetical protein U9N56_02130 [Actinomycetota bacterium]|nr:hypothetical protein [Actinomycetota bacterium]